MAAASAVCAAPPDADEGRTIEFHGGVQTTDRNSLFGDPLDISLKERRKARDVAEGLALLTGYNFDPGRCGDYELGPLDDGVRRTGKEFWLALIAPFTRTVRITERLDTRPAIIANLRYGETIHDFSIPRGPRTEVLGAISRQLGQQLSMNPHEGVAGEMEVEVGPIEGRMSINEAFRIVIQNDDFMIRWGDEGASWVSIEPASREVVYADMSESECTMGLPELGRMTVIESRLHSLQDEVPTPVEVFDRERIERSGAASLPELLRYATQTAFTSAPGSRLNGAQYAEGRGLGPALVLIEGQRTMVSASSVQDSAFDLNTIPLSAVEKVEIVPDSGSIVHGVDSVGGIVNIVLRSPKERVALESRYGAAQGGAIERRVTALARSHSETHDGVIVADQLESTNLLGRERSRYANQDYTRYRGGVDRRSIASEQGNLMIGTTLMGLPPPDGRTDFDESDLSAQPNLTSLLRYQSIAPGRQRDSLVATGKLIFDAAELFGNLIYTRQDTEYTLPPPSVSGEQVAEDHPQNFLKQPVLYFGLLSGLPSLQYQTKSDFSRAALGSKAHLLGWDLELSAAHTEDDYAYLVRNAIDPLELTGALSSNDPKHALYFFAPAPGMGRSDLLARSEWEHERSAVTQLGLLSERTFSLRPAEDARLQLGAEWRRESVHSTAVEGNPGREVTGIFVNVGVPIFRSLSLSAGARQDGYSDGGSATSSQLGVQWRPVDHLRIFGDAGQRYSPPSLFQLNMAEIPFNMPVTDPKTGQTEMAAVIFGGKRFLRPTSADSRGLGFSLTTDGNFELALHYWQLRLRDRISSLPLGLTLQYEDYLPGRVLRDESVVAGIPGPIRTINLGWQNLGVARASGVDGKIRTEVPLWGGSLASELGFTWNLRYSSRELPGEVSPLSERVNIASELGTIPRYRAIAQLAWEDSDWRIAAAIVEVSRYWDFDPMTQARFGVSSETNIDFNLSRRWGSSSLTIGALNAFDAEPGYSNIGAWGYDTSQGNLRGRFVFAEMRIGF